MSERKLSLHLTPYALEQTKAQPDTENYAGSRRHVAMVDHTPRLEIWHEALDALEQSSLRLERERQHAQAIRNELIFAQGRGSTAPAYVMLDTSRIRVLGQSMVVRANKVLDNPFLGLEFTSSGASRLGNVGLLVSGLVVAGASYKSDLDAKRAFDGAYPDFLSSTHWTIYDLRRTIEKLPPLGPVEGYDVRGIAGGPQ